jgi:hypothetical protein
MISKSFKGILTGENLVITVYIWTIYILFNLISCGMLIITPYIYKDAGSNFNASFLAYFCEIPAILLAMIFIDSPKYGGRIKIILYGLAILIIIELVIYFGQT